MLNIKIIFSLLVLLPLVAGAAEEDSEVFARHGNTILTHELIDAAFSRIPERDRLAYIRDGKNVDFMVKNILTNLALAEQARAEGFEQQALVKGRMQLAEDKELADAWVEHLVATAPPADYEALAREYYLLNKEEMMTLPIWDATHLLLKTENRSVEQATALANDLLARVLDDPGLFDELVLEYSDDRTVQSNKGRIPKIVPGRVAKPFENALSTMDEPGIFPEVVQTSFGLHLVRLDSVTPVRQLEFEEVKQRLINMQKTDYREQLGKRFVSEVVSSAPLEYPDGAIDKMLRRYFGENLEKAPKFDQ